MSIETSSSKLLFYFILALVFLRPSLDIISEIEIKIHSDLPSFTPTLILGVLVFSIGFFSLFLQNPKRTPRIPLFWPILFFILCLTASLFYSIDKSSSFQELVRVLTIFLLYFLAYLSFRTKKEFYLLLKVIFASYLLPAAFAFGQLLLGIGKIDHLGGFQRIYGTFAHSNPFAFYTFFVLGLAFSLALVILMRNKSPEQGKKIKLDPRLVWGFVFILIFLLFQTHTRSAIASLAIFIFVFGIFKYRKILLAGTIFFLGVYFFSDVFQQRIWELLTLDPYGSVVWRLRLWQDMLPIASWQIWFGYGLGTFEKMVQYYRGFEWGSLQAHNDYLKIFLENGILGLSAFLIILGNLFYRLTKIFKDNGDNLKIISLGVLVTTFCLFLAASFDNIFRETALQWNLWILLGAWLKINLEPEIIDKVE